MFRRMTPVKQTVLLPDDVALKLRLEAAELNVSQQEIMLAGIRAHLSQDDRADEEGAIPDLVHQVNAVIALLQSFPLDTDQLKAIHKELGRMVAVPKRQRSVASKSTDPKGKKVSISIPDQVRRIYESVSEGKQILRDVEKNDREIDKKLAKLLPKKGQK
jgi:hypothetical protein